MSKEKDKLYFGDNVIIDGYLVDGCKGAEGKKGNITRSNPNSGLFQNNKGINVRTSMNPYKVWRVNESSLRFIEKGEDMSKHEEIRNRIKNLDDGCTLKEVDDILNEIMEEGYKVNSFYISIGTDTSISILDFQKNCLKYFSYKNQCEKFQALKKAMLWLLNRSDIKKEDNAKEIASIKAEIDKLQKRVEELS